MHIRRPMPNGIIFALVAFFLAAGAATAQPSCFPHCDYAHYYGPYDFTYVSPGLYGYPHCGPQGDCVPHLAYTTGVEAYNIGVLRPSPKGRITVLFPRVRATRRP